jgi:putative spermidine/putrescine transport system ATP-binding protein
VVVMNQGSIEQAATPHDIYARPRSPYVARFMGGQNVLTGKVRSIDGAFALVDGPTGSRFRVPLAGRKPAPGSDVHLAVRRELIRLTAQQSAGEPRENSFHDVVESVEYQGIYFKITLAKVSGEEFIVVEPEAVFFAHPVQRGDAVIVSWDSEHSRLLEADRAPGGSAQPYADDSAG